MRNILIIAVLLVSADGASVTVDLEMDGEKINILEQEHRRARADSAPSAANMRPLKWDPELAKEARDTSRDCYNKQHDVLSVYGTVGLNEYIAEGQLGRFSTFARNAFSSWEAEMINYDFYKASCSGQCGNYTQLVWAESYRFGCGMTTCDGVNMGDGRRQDESTLLICKYYPAGNKEGQAPFIEGVRCSRCDSNREKCVDNAFCSDPARDSAGPTRPIYITLLVFPVVVGTLNNR